MKNRKRDGLSGSGLNVPGDDGAGSRLPEGSPAQRVSSPSRSSPYTLVNAASMVLPFPSWEMNRWKLVSPNSSIMNATTLNDFW